MEQKVLCGRIGCQNPTSSSQGEPRRVVSNVELCAACYQRCWKIAKRTHVSLQAAWVSMQAKHKPVSRPRIEQSCARPGCKRRLGKGEERRYIDNTHLCSSCYQAAWKLSKREGIDLVVAFKKLNPIGWRPPRPPTPPPPTQVVCTMPWCKMLVHPHTHLLTDGSPVCVACLQHLQWIAKRYADTHRRWDEWGILAKRGEVLAPDAHETCAARWCSRRVGGRKGKQTHNRFVVPGGLAFCGADHAYLQRYAKAHGVSFSQAVKQAPPPRLVHIRTQTS